MRIAVLGMLLAWPAAGVVHSAEPDGHRTGCARTDTDRPAPALIRTDQGRVRQVSFDVAWEVYEGRRPGTVLAVCVDGARHR